MTDAARYLGKHVVIYPAFDHRREHRPMDTGRVIAYLDGPRVIVEHEDGTRDAWLCSMPMDVGDLP